MKNNKLLGYRLPGSQKNFKYSLILATGYLTPTYTKKIYLIKIHEIKNKTVLGYWLSGSHMFSKDEK